MKTFTLVVRVVQKLIFGTGVVQNLKSGTAVVQNLIFGSIIFQNVAFQTRLIQKLTFGCQFKSSKTWLTFRIRVTYSKTFGIWSKMETINIDSISGPSLAGLWTGVSLRSRCVLLFTPYARAGREACDCTCVSVIAACDCTCVFGLAECDCTCVSDIAACDCTCVFDLAAGDCTCLMFQRPLTPLVWTWFWPPPPPSRWTGCRDPTGGVLFRVSWFEGKLMEEKLTSACPIQGKLVWG